MRRTDANLLQYRCKKEQHRGFTQGAVYTFWLGVHKSVCVNDDDGVEHWLDNGSLATNFEREEKC